MKKKIMGMEIITINMMMDSSDPGDDDLDN